METPKPKPAPEPQTSSREPACDEWGIYNPEQAGLAAVLRRIAEAPRDKRTPNSGA